jgi:hypothetical protein
MIKYDDVRMIAPMYHSVIAENWRAERVLDYMGLEEGASAPLYYVATCIINSTCVYHLYEVTEKRDLIDIAAHLTMVILLARLIATYMLLGLCKGESATEVYEDCVKHIIDGLLEIAEKRGDKLIPEIVGRFDNPTEIFCTPDIIQEHKH